MKNEKISVSDKDSLFTIVNAQLDKLGMPAQFRLDNDTNGISKVLGNVIIDPSELGLLAPGINKMNLEIKAGSEGRNKVGYGSISLYYTYQSPSRTSSNSISVHYNYEKGKWQVS